MLLGGEQSLIEKLCLGASLVNEIKYGNCFRVAILMNPRCIDRAQSIGCGGGIYRILMDEIPCSNFKRIRIYTAEIGLFKEPH